MAVMSWASFGSLSNMKAWVQGNIFALFLVAFLGLALPGFLAYWLMISPFLVLYVARYIVLVGLLLLAFQIAIRGAPWYVRVVLAMILGQMLFNYGFSNIVIGAGGAKFTMAELGVAIGLLFLLPKTFPVLRHIPAFWVCMTALLVPPAIHLYPNIRDYGMAALRDVLSVVDLMYFLAGLSVCIYGLMMGRWMAWRMRFLTIWIIGGSIYGAMAPLSPYILAISPGFQSYQQTIPVLGHMLTAPYNAIAAVAAWYAVPRLYPAAAWLRYPLVVVVMLGSLAAIVLAQSRNLYGAFLLLPVVLAYFGYRKAFSATLAGVVLMIAALGLLETFEVKIPGRISDVTLSAFVDRILSVSGKHGDAVGAHGVQQRMDWWSSSLNKWSVSPETMVFGLGYGQALTNFSAPGGDYGEGVVVREPHNSFISSLSRGGVVYLCLWLYLILSPVIAAAKGARMTNLDPETSMNYRGVATLMVIVMGMLLLTAVSEPIFETPSIAAMYYFVAGVAIVEYLVVSGRIRVPALGAK
ncbi:MAG: O-antigen ligase family protein [Aquabacterium sp.]|uniref:O-antigen ligase family protein n=1 Tax=Aquabacterium sp. TaxID=1872578 RepID=UPI0025BB16B7|nr:O-antigen ligase family protein [Aquabacterium sp.]MBI5926415.1 O-antigen ligase family protein [Aquabacterium sp.]